MTIRSARRAHSALFFAALSLALGRHGRADEIYWQGGVDDWFTPANWDDQSQGDSNVVPGFLDNVYIDNGAGPTLSSGNAQAGNEYVGLNGTGTFTQTGGTNTLNTSGGLLSIGDGIGSTGVYTLSANGALSVAIGNEFIGNGGSGSFIQTGGTNTIGTFNYAATDLDMAAQPGSTGTYSLSGTGVLTAIDNEIVGDYGTATFNQTGGTNTISSVLLLGRNGGSNGTYNLSGGQLTGNGVLFVGGSFVGAGGTGMLTVSNTGQLNIPEIFVYNTDQLIINGGTATADVLNLVGGSYAQTAGTATVGRTTGSGTLTLTGGQLALSDGGTSQIGNVSISGTATLQVAQYTSMSSLTMNGGSILLPTSGEGTIVVQNAANLTAGSFRFFPSGAPNNSSFALLTAGSLSSSLALTPSTFGRLTFTPSVDGNSIVVNVTGSPASLVWNNFAGGDGQTWDVQGNKNWTGSATIGNPNQFYALDNTLFNDTNRGNYTVIIASSGVQPSSLTVNTTATYTFSGGPISGGTTGLAVNGGTLVLQNANSWFGTVTADGGTLALTGTGSLLAPEEDVGYNGTGNFTQTGGTNTITGKFDGLILGYNSGSTGTYSLGGSGSLSVQFNGESAEEFVGFGGTGNFIQSGGTNTALFVSVGDGAGAVGTYTLSGGQLSTTGGEFVGNDGAGIFNQSGGTNTVVSDGLTVGNDSGSTGTYILSGTGALVASSENVGFDGGGTFNQSGGTNTTGSLNITVGDSAGTYTLSGNGLLSAGGESVGQYALGIFNQSGGANNITSGGSLIIGGTGTYTLSGSGQLSVSGAEILGGDFGGEDTTGLTANFNQTGGINTVAGELDIGISMNFNSAITVNGAYNLSAGTLTVNGDAYVGGASSGAGGTGTLTISGAGIVSIAGTLTAFSTPSTAINVNGGTVTAAAFINNASYIQTAGNASLGAISGTGSVAISGGKAIASSINLTSLSLSNSGSFQILANGTNTAASTLNSLTFAGSSNNWTGTLDLANNKLIIEPTALAKSTTLAALQNQLAFGRTHTAGITSTALPPNTALALLDNAVTQFSTFGGQPVDSNSLLLSPELLGDANADGHVDLSDLSTVLNHFGQSTPNWTDGNFDYSTTIDLTDLSDVLNNFGLSNPNTSSQSSALGGGSPQSPAPTPEPTSLALLLPALLLTKKRAQRPRA